MGYLLRMIKALKLSVSEVHLIRAFTAAKKYRADRVLPFVSGNEKH